MGLFSKKQANATGPGGKSSGLLALEAGLDKADELLAAAGINARAAAFCHGDDHDLIIAVVVPEEGDIYESLDRLPGPEPIIRILEDVYRFQPLRVDARFYNEHTWRFQLSGRGEPRLLWHPIGVAARPEPVPEPASIVSQAARDSLAEMKQTIAEADKGDPVAEKRVQAASADARGDRSEAFRLYEDAAKMGDVVSMYDAGCSASHLGLDAQATFWWESAAAAGNAAAMYNLGASNVDNMSVAKNWFERAAAAGDADACGALTQIAYDAGDEEEEFRWSQLGTERGQPFCMFSYGLLLAMRSPDDPAAKLRGADMMKRAGEAGAADAMYSAGVVYLELGDRDNGRSCLERAAADGDSRAAVTMSDHQL